MPTSSNREPCLSFVRNSIWENSETSIAVELSDYRDGSRTQPPDWNVLNAMTTVRKICVRGARDKNCEKGLLELALAIKSHRNLVSMYFSDIHFRDFDCLGKAISEQAQSSSSQLFSLHFFRCSFEHCAAKVLRSIIQSWILVWLSFSDCDIEADFIDRGLHQNRGLREFEFVVHSFGSHPWRMKGVTRMLDMSEKLIGLTLTVGHASFWEGFRAANCTKSLRSLTFCNTKIDNASVDAILLKCFMVPSLTELGFETCAFASQSPFDLLVKAVSEHKILEILSVDDITIANSIRTTSEPTFEFSCGNLQINKLRFRGHAFNLVSSTMLLDIASNPNIQSLDLKWGTLSKMETVERLCNTLLVPNRGPSELILYESPFNDADMIAHALRHNTNLTSLDIGNLFGSNAVAFAQALSGMVGLRKLTIRIPDKESHTRAFLQALVDSLEQNTTLQTLSLRGVSSLDPVALLYLPRIRFYLAINRIGRQSLLTVMVPNGIWAHVLAKTSEEADGIYYILTNKPDIIVARSRKRKDREDEGL